MSNNIIYNTVLARLSGPRLSGRFWGDFLSAEGKFGLQYVPPGFLGKVY